MQEPSDATRQNGAPTDTTPAFISPIKIAAIAVLCLIALGAHFAHGRVPRSEPEVAVKAVFQSLNAGELESLRAMAIDAWFHEFVSHFGDQKHQRVTSAFNRVSRLGQRQWQILRQRADAEANAAYDDLRQRVYSLGSDALRRLPADEGFRLIQDPYAREARRWEAGVDALSIADRQRVGNASELRAGTNRSRFIANEGWNYLSQTDQEQLGAPAALAQADTPEKLAFLDRIGMTLADNQLKQEVAGIERQELVDRAAFQMRHGLPLAEQYLKTAGIPAVISYPQCLYPALESTGSLLKGLAARCRVTTNTAQGQGEIVLSFFRIERAWQLAGMTPMPYNVW